MDAELVEVEVAVNFDSLRRGQVGQVELTDRIQKLISNGYLRLLGHVTPVPEPPVVPRAVTHTEVPAARTKRSAAKRKAATDPVGEVVDDGDSQSAV